MSLTALVSYEVSRGSAKAVNIGQNKKRRYPSPHSQSSTLLHPSTRGFLLALAELQGTT